MREKSGGFHDGIEKFLEHRFGWFDAAYARNPLVSTLRLVLGIGFVLVFLPLLAIGHVHEISQAVKIVFHNASPWWVFWVTIFLWFSITLAAVIVCHREIAVAVSLLNLRTWCSKKGCSSVANTIATKKRHLVGSWRACLEAAMQDQDGRSSQEWVLAVNALVNAYLTGLSDIRLGKSPGADMPRHPTENLEPSLPSNFLLYGFAVQQVRNAVSKAYGPSKDVTVGIRTLLTKDVSQWYNILRIHTKDDSPLWCSTKWWEDYKKTVHNKNLRKQGISLHRLLRYETPTIEEQKKFLRLQISNHNYDREYLTPKDFLEAKRDLEAKGLAQFIQWRNGVDLISDPIPEELAALPINPICEVIASGNRTEVSKWHTDRYRFSSAFEDYRAYHDTADPIQPAPGVAGAWGKTVEEDQVPAGLNFMKDYDDLFLIEFREKQGGKALLGRFGISFRMEEAEDIAGIYLMSAADAGKAIEQFDQCWAAAREL